MSTNQIYADYYTIEELEKLVANVTELFGVWDVRKVNLDIYGDIPFEVLPDLLQAIRRMQPVIAAVRQLRDAIAALDGIAAAEQALLAALATYEETR